jgi:hypothetical protein
MDDAEDRAPRQRTPKGAEIPVPKRGDFLRNMEKVAPPAKPETDEPESPARGDVEK